MVGKRKITDTSIKSDNHQSKKINISNNISNVQEIQNRKKYDRVGKNIIKNIRRNIFEKHYEKLLNFNEFDWEKIGNNLFKPLLDCPDLSVLEHIFSNSKNLDKIIPQTKYKIIHRLIKNNEIKKLELLLNNNIVDVNYENNKGNIFLHKACLFGRSNIIDVLVDFGCHLNIQNKLGQTPLHIACKQGDIGIIEKLIDYGADLTVKEYEYQSAPVFISYKLENFIDIIDLFIHRIDLGNVLCQTNNTKKTLLHLVCSYDTYDCVKHMIDKIKSVEKDQLIDQLDDYGMSPIFYACINNSYHKVKLLLENGADINRVNDKNFSLLHFACKYNSLDIVKLLVDSGCDVNCKNNMGYTPLHYACINSSLELVEFLISSGANPNFIEHMYNQTPLFFVTSESLDIHKLLIDKINDINLTNYRNQTMLHVACMFNLNNVVKFLIEHGLNIDHVDTLQMTPLHWACKKGNLEMVKLLVKHGAITNSKDIQEQTPIDTAKCRKFDSIVEFLTSEVDAFNAECN